MSLVRDPFRSFWMGGFEGADHHNSHGQALDMAAAHGHVAQCEEDYARAASLGIATVRESMGWRLCETAPGVFDFERPLRMAAAARRQGVQLLWTLMHYGTPPDVSLLDDALIGRFEAFAAAAARALADAGGATPVYTLVNEINFLAWAAAETNLIGGYVGDPAHTGESSCASGYEIKRRLVRATLAAQHAVRRIDPAARFMQVEPLVHVVAPADRPELAAAAEEVASFQWQTWDILAGRVEPGLGGAADMLDLVGVNHYHNGQWEVGTERRLHWHTQDPRRRGLDLLLRDAWRRYGRPLVVSETSHVGAGRGLWLSDIASQVQQARVDGVPVWGLCLYPLVDRPDWNAPGQWHHSGLWDVPALPTDRVLNGPYALALAQWQERLPDAAPLAKPWLVVFSHRRWTLARHRTQHLMTRLARRYRIAYVEAPRPTSGSARLAQFCPQPDVVVLCPHTADALAGFEGGPTSDVARLLRAFAYEHAIAQPIAWLTTPEAAPLARGLDPTLVVFDAGAGAALASVDEADLVFAAARGHATDAIALPPAVDAADFDPRQLSWGGSEAQEAGRLLAACAGPLLGYVGNIDERVDMALLLAVADARPQWQLVMIGLAESEAQALPQRPNLHWLGPQPYSVLPYLLARLNVCLLPFKAGARGQPCQAPQLLEYLANGRPVVATASANVPARFAPWVSMAADTDSFMRACASALAGPAIHTPDAVFDTHDSWEQRADTVLGLLEQELSAVAEVETP
jgi:glycosyltransferase involved in cell wall biosynthesis